MLSFNEICPSWVSDDIIAINNIIFIFKCNFFLFWFKGSLPIFKNKTNEYLASFARCLYCTTDNTNVIQIIAIIYCFSMYYLNITIFIRLEGNMKTSHRQEPDIKLKDKITE